MSVPTVVTKSQVEIWNSWRLIAHLKSYAVAAPIVVKKNLFSCSTSYSIDCSKLQQLFKQLLLCDYDTVGDANVFGR
jgi:hypothetical protein